MDFAFRCLCTACYLRRTNPQVRFGDCCNKWRWWWWWWPGTCSIVYGWAAGRRQSVVVSDRTLTTSLFCCRRRAMEELIGRLCNRFTQTTNTRNPCTFNRAGKLFQKKAMFWQSEEKLQITSKVQF